jgi:capsular polysaccharide biosynthesis protein
MAGPAPALLDQDADPTFAELLMLRPLFDGPAVALPHAGLSLPLRLSPAPPGSLRARLRWLGEGVPAGEEVLDLGVPAAAEGGAGIRIEPDVLPPAGRYDLAIRIENSAGEGLARLMLPVDVTEFGTPPPALRPDAALLRRRSLVALPGVPLGPAPPSTDARIELSPAEPVRPAPMSAADRDRLIESGVSAKRLSRVDMLAPSSVFLLHDVALIGARPQLCTRRGVVENGWGGQEDGPGLALAALGVQRAGLPRLGTAAFALPTWRRGATTRTLTEAGHGHLHTEHLCALLQIEALVRAWPEAGIRTVLPEYGPFQREAVELLGAELGDAGPIGEAEFRAERLLVPGYGFHSRQVPTLVAEVYRRIRRNALAGWSRTPGAARIHVSRLGSPLRRLRNEEQLVAAMQARGFAVFDARGMSYREQVLAFADARVVVGPHGSGFANLGFAAPGALMVEAFSPYYHDPAFQHMAGILGHRYRAFAQPPIGKLLPPGAEWDLDIPRFLDFLDPILESEHLAGRI